MHFHISFELANLSHTHTHTHSVGMEMVFLGGRGVRVYLFNNFKQSAFVGDAVGGKEGK